MGYIKGEDIEDIYPQTYEKVITSIDFGKWQETMNSEMDSMYSNKVWNLVNAPKGIISIGCKWIFKKKIGINGKVETYKTRLVANETLSLVAMLKSIQILLVITTH